MKVSRFGHVAFRCRNLHESLDFYCGKLGFPERFRLCYRDCAESHRRGAEASGKPADEAYIAKLMQRADDAWIVYVAVTDDVFIELFDAGEATTLSLPDNTRFNYRHFALAVDDIHALRDELTAKGVVIDSGPTYGVEGTWQMWTHDPDGNQIEWMQYTPESMQLTGRKG